MKFTFGENTAPEDEAVFAASDLQLDEEAKALTDEQNLAVGQPLGQSVLVVAGAGTGKTRCLTARIARALREGVPARKLLALTFTNRAAREMQSRVADMLPPGHPSPWIGTYHACAASLLRQIPEHLMPLEFPHPFQIIDENDRLRMLVQASTRFAPEKSGAKLDKADAAGLLDMLSGFHHSGGGGPKAFCRTQDQLKTTLEISRSGRPPFTTLPVSGLVAAFEEEKHAAKALDYDGLIQWILRFGEEEPACIPDYQMIAVDEFQDTDAMQNRMLHVLSGQGRCPVFAVGDEDQSIYVWRGAKIENFLRFGERKDVVTCWLTGNFRSPTPVIETANRALLANRKRRGKTLHAATKEQEDTRFGPGGKIQFLEFEEDWKEADWIAETIQNSLSQGETQPSDWAILCRTARGFARIEQSIARLGTPYRVAAGRRLAEYEETANLAALLRHAGWPADNFAMERILTRLLPGIGAKTVARLREEAGTGSLFEAIQSRPAGLRAKALEALDRYCESREETVARLEGEGLEAAVSAALQSSGIQAALEAPQTVRSKREANQRRLERLGEIQSLASEIDRQGGAPMERLEKINEVLTLAPRGDESEAEKDQLVIGTVHSAKGGEWPCVVVAALNEGVLPAAQQAETRDILEEERRILHVALSRAREGLFLTWALVRNGRETQPSRFLQEIRPESPTMAE